jgi:di/tricarboxylate transporter
VQHAGDGAGRLPVRRLLALGLPLSVIVVLVGVPLIALFWPLRPM